MNTMSIEGQVAFVSGASRGIGAAIALALAREGFTVVGTATSASGVEQINKHLSAWGQSKGLVLDVCDKKACEQAIESVTQEFGGLHVLVNNAGITKDMLAMRLKDEDWDQVIATNLSAVFGLSKAAIRPMMRQRYGRIINITSVVGASGNAGQSNYAAAKAGVAGMTRSLARELGSRSITVNCVAPGFIQTDMTAQLTQAQTQGLLDQIPLGHLGSVQDVAHAVSFLASPKASYITGQQLHVNGGMFMA